MPGVYSRTEDGMGLRPNIGIRGVNPDRSKKITLMEDGVLFGPAPYSAPAAYYFPLITRMTQVRVIKGPAAIAYGPQTVGGAIDFITRAIPDDAFGRRSISPAGQYGYGKVHAYFGASDEQFGFLVEGVRLQNNGFKELMTDGPRHGLHQRRMDGQGLLRRRSRRRRANEFRLKLGYSDEVSNETYMGLAPEDFERESLRALRRHAPTTA